jgi:arylsulfatase A-like enzyme
MYYANYRERSTDGKLPERVETRLHAAYRDTIRSVDGFVEQLLSDIDGNPSLVFHSDHGDAFYEHGTYGHHSELYEENIHVPLLVYDGETTGRVSGPVSLRTLPDIVCRLGTDVPLDPESWTSEFVMSVTEGISKLALRSNHWKYIAGDEEEVYNLAADPEETHDLSGEHQEVTAAFRQLLRLNRQHIDEVATIVETAAAFDEPVPKQRGSQT